MAQRGSDLASRLKTALDEEEAAAARAEEERQRRLEAAKEAREALLDDLAAFGEAVGHLAVQRSADGLVLRRGERFLAFEPMGEADRVRVTFTGSEGQEHRLDREPALQDRWVWSFTRRRRADRLPLFDTGLEELLVLALQVPRVTPVEEEDPIVARPSRDRAFRTPSAKPDPFEAFADAPKTTPDPEEPDEARTPVKRTL